MRDGYRKVNLQKKNIDLLLTLEFSKYYLKNGYKNFDIILIIFSHWTTLKK